MQHLCSSLEGLYTEFLGVGENSTKHGRAGTFIVCYVAVVIHFVTQSHALMQDLQDWVLTSGGTISCNSPVRGFIFYE